MSDRLRDRLREARRSIVDWHEAQQKTSMPEVSASPSLPLAPGRAAGSAPGSVFLDESNALIRMALAFRRDGDEDLIDAAKLLETAGQILLEVRLRRATHG